MLRLRSAFPLLGFAAIALAAGCGGGGGTAGPALPVAPTPVVGPTTLPVGPTPATAFISGDGYTLSFVVPKVINGSAGTMSAVLQTNLPTGAAAPQGGQRRSSSVRRPSAPIGNAQGLVYLIVSTTTSVEFGSAPSFVFTTPSGTMIPAGQLTYLWYWDPYQNTWIHLLGPGTIGTPSTTQNSITFPTVATDVKLNANAQYIFALLDTTSAVPTATPAPTPAPPSPGSSPTPIPLASYCGSYASNASAGAVPVNITDDSGLGAALIVYIQNGNWMDNTGKFNSKIPYPLPAGCFSTTLGSSAQNKPLNIPQGASGRIYLAYATPNPSGTAPNPFNGLTGAPNVDFASSPYPWDFLEYTATTGSGIIDTSQVDAVGLPLELSLTSGMLPHQTAGSCQVSPSSVVGVTSCGFASIFQQMSAVPQYNQLVITQKFNGKNLDMRVVSPQSAFFFTSFQWNLFGLSAYAPSTSPCTAGNTLTSGYIGCVLAAYQSQPRLFSSSVAGASGSGDWYCATSDGSANFIFTDVGSTMPSSCVGAHASSTHQLTANPFKLPITTLAYGTPPAKDNGNAAQCQYNILFGQPYGLAYVDNQQLTATTNTGTGNLFSGRDAFAMWKALVADLNYGTSLSTLKHPVGQFVPLQMSSFWQDPMYNTYSNVLHANFDRTYAYSLAYDDLYGWSTSLTLQKGNAINVRINAVPTASAVSAPPAPVANPISCPTIAPEIGTY